MWQWCTAPVARFSVVWVQSRMGYGKVIRNCTTTAAMESVMEVSECAIDSGWESSFSLAIRFN